LSSNPDIEAAVEAAPAPPAVNQAWFLQSAGRVFGPLVEDEMRGYFRAGMVKPGDAIAMPGQVGTVSAIEAAALLGMAPPPPATASAAAPATTPPTSIVVKQVGEPSRVGRMLVLFALVAIVGLAYLVLHEPAQPRQDTSRPTAQQPGEPVASNTPQTESAPAAPAFDAPSFAPPPRSTSTTAPPIPTAVQKTRAETAPTDDPAPTAGSDDWWSQASQLYDQQNWTALQAHADKWTQAQPRRDLAWWYLGVARYRQGDYPGTVAAAQQAIAISPRYVKARWLLSDGYMGTLQWHKSLDILNELLREQPNDAGLWNDIGIDQANLGEYDDSIAALEKAVQLDPGYRQAWVNLAQSYASFGNMDRAKAALAKANTL